MQNLNLNFTIPELTAIFTSIINTISQKCDIEETFSEEFYDICMKIIPHIDTYIDDDSIREIVNRISSHRVKKLPKLFRTKVFDKKI
jgi:hypothetical protein